LVTKFCDNPLKWWKAHETLPIVGNLAYQILGFVGSQIEARQFIS
jgi:hypothetical protein